ncbi:MAG: histone deacetylase, partial [Dehalococcoidia bacterium]
MTNVGLVYDPLYLWHDTGAHPESALRLTAIMHVLTEAGLTARLVPLAARDATVEEVAMVHSERYIASIRDMAEHGGAWADPDTYISPRSYDVALRAGGGCIEATDRVL